MKRREVLVFGILIATYVLGLGVPVDAPLAAMDAVLARRDVTGAERGWRAFAALGDTALRVGDTARDRGPYVARAREMRHDVRIEP